MKTVTVPDRNGKPLPLVLEREAVRGLAVTRSLDRGYRVTALPSGLAIGRYKTAAQADEARTALLKLKIDWTAKAAAYLMALPAKTRAACGKIVDAVNGSRT